MKKKATLSVLSCCCIVALFTHFAVLRPDAVASQSSQSSAPPFAQGAWQSLYDSPLMQKAASAEAKQAWEQLPPGLQRSVKAHVDKVMRDTLEEKKNNPPPRKAYTIEQLLGFEPVNEGTRGKVYLKDSQGNNRASDVAISEYLSSAGMDFVSTSSFTAPAKTS